ncbi:class I SAM-dependent methyltransferase [bacterium]|nr:class I SAM-dependent methyltransferase [bacterium]MBU1652476.1 class I SAM-dependent methyltransferase [bacterium]
MRREVKANKKYWDELAKIHYNSYHLDKLRKGGISLDSIQTEELGDISNKKLLHLQCHIGSDSLSLVRLGAEVTAIDLSPKSIEYAIRLSKELGLPARFIECELYDAPQHVQEQFDIVYISQGAICWLHDLAAWAKLIFDFLNPGGFLYIMDTHPVLYSLEEKQGKLDFEYSYFHNEEPLQTGGEPDYADASFVSENPTYEWIWPISDILNALIAAGLRIEFFNEYDRIFYKALDSMVQDEDGWWVLPNHRGKIPLTFTLKAFKP